ncbi:M15 family metallopeptidase [Pedobacter aquatilis]|uniref:M15 family metallopeptidase n=1 Tax=Pedobacter aquatilis TaxID=351343 RepID=UPI00292D9044|nr:M15 family metallopeptidase [Pedobacter aquatilis]
MINDKPTANIIAKVHPKLRVELTKIVEEIQDKLTGNASMRLTQGLRTIDYQNSLYNQGRTTKGSIVTNAKGGQSLHNYGLAVDFCLILDGKTMSYNEVKDFDGDAVADWKEVVTVFKAYGWKWGGDFKSIKDSPHFEKTFSNTWQQLLVKYNNNQTITDNGEKYVIL